MPSEAASDRPLKDRQTARPVRKPRPTGQWALGQTEPLNDNERLKAEDNGLNVRERVESTYSKEGFDSIPVDDLRGRLRWWGLYTQRRQGIPGGKTASLPPEELDDKYFMMRVRSDGGALTSQQARTIAKISSDFARNTADISDRQNIQLHWIRIEDVPEIWRRLERVGLGTTEACGDVPRVILGSPVAGVAADEIIDGTWAMHEILRRYVGDPKYANLPRKFKTAISGSRKQDVVHEINDISFVGVEHPEHGPGWDIWVGGGLSTVPKLAVRLGAWIPNRDVPDVWEAVISIFRDYGYRRLRNKARLKFLVADWGPEKFREVLETEYLKRPLSDGPPPPAPPAAGRDHVGIHEQKDGNFYVGAAPTVGRLSAKALKAVADLAEEHGTGRIRLTVQQKLVILDVPGNRTQPLSAELAALGLEVRPSQFRRGTMACTGIEFCKLAIVETKDRARALITELETRRPDLDLPLSINVNGCPNSCARFQVSDIGLKGMLATNSVGDQTEGFQIHLGGSLGTSESESEFGRSVKALKLPAEELGDYVDRLIGRYLDAREQGESFAQWTARAEDVDLR